MSKTANYFKPLTIGNCIAELPKSKLPASAAVENGKYPFICSSSELKYTDIYLQDKLAVVMGTGGVASVNLGKGVFAYSTDTWAFRSNSPDVDTEFLFRKIQQLLPEIDYAAFEGSGLKHLRKDYVKKLEIPVPSRAEISNKILYILAVTDQTIDKTEALIEKYQQIKTGLMRDLFTRGIDANGKLRPPREQAPVLYQETPIGWIPKEWRINKINDLAAQFKGSTVIGPFGSDLVMSDYRTEGTPVIFVRDVKEDSFGWVSDVFISSQKTRKLFAHRVNEGDLLATKMGLPPCVSCVYPEGMPMGIITADMIRMTIDNSKADSYWLSSAINHDRIKRQIAAITAGVTRPKVTLADFRSLKIATPSLEEQLAVNAILDRTRKLITSEKDRLIKLQKQKSGLMHDLLTGKVQVNSEAPEADHA